MKIQRMPEDIVPLLNDLVRRITALETRPLGTVFVNETIIAKDPETGVETIIGDLTEYGEDRTGIKQWVNDTEPPAVPVMPIVTSNLGVFSVVWTGFFSNDAPMAPDFSHLNVYGNNGTSTKLVGVIKTKDEVAIVTLDSEAMYDEVWSFWFTSVDQVGNESLPGEISAGNKLTPLVEAPDMVKILDEIDEKFGGVITEAQQLNDKLAQAETDIDKAQADLNDLETVRLPAVEANIEAAHQEIVSTGNELGTRLTQAETDIATAESGLNTIKNTDLPALNQRLANAETEITTTGQQLDSRLDDAFIQIGTVDSKTQANATAASNAQTAADAANAFAQEQVALLVARGQNLVRNGDFEAGQVGWNSSGNAEVKSVNARSGSKSMNITAPSVNTWPTSDWVPAGPGRTYYVEYYIREGGTPDDSGSVGAVAQVKTAAGGTASFTFAQTASSAIPNFAFTKVSGTVTPGTADIVAIRFAPWVQGPTTSSYDIDDFLAVDVTEAQEALNAAATAQSRADSAHTAAGNAQTTANNALTMAGSKNSVFYSANAPSGTANTGDTWRQVNAKGDVIAEWRWTSGGTWLAQQVTTEMISNLDVGKLTAGTANISDLVVEKLWAEVIRAKKITADQLLVGSGTNLIVDPYLEDATVKSARATASSLAGGYGRNSVTNLNWYGGTQPTGSVQTYYFSATSSRIDTSSMIPIVEGSKYRFKFLYNSVSGGARPVASIIRKDGTSGVTASGFVTNGVATSGFGGAGSGQTMEAVWTPDPSWNYAYFVPGIQWESTVTSAHIYGGASVQDMTDGSLIVNGSIDADSINTNSIVAEVAKFIKLDVSSLIASNATINTAVIEKLWTDVIRSRKITTDQLLVGQGENLISWDVNSTLPDRASNFTEYGSTGNKIGVQAAAGVADGNHLFMDANWVTSGTATNTWRIISDPSASPWQTQGFKVEPAEEFQAQIYVRAGGSYASGMPSVALAGVWYKADGTYIVTTAGTSSGLTWSWDKREVSLKAPATAAYLHLYVRQDQPGGIRVDLPSLYRKKGASLIVENGIQAKHIEASESMSAKIGQFLKLDVKDLISTGSAKLNQAVIDKLWTDVVHSKKITSDMVVIGGTNNLIPNANVLTDLAGWETSTANLLRTTGSNGPDATTPYMYVTNRGNIRSADFEVSGGNRFRFKVKAHASVTGSRIYVQIVTNGTGNPYVIDNQALTTSWDTYSGEVDLAEDVTKASINIYVNHVNGVVTTQRFAYMSLIQMASGELVVDGAITALKIHTDAVEARHIKANAVEADKIKSGAIKTSHLAVGTGRELVGNGSGQLGDNTGFESFTYGTRSSSTPVGHPGYFYSTAGQGTTNFLTGDNMLRVKPNTKYKVSVWVRASSSGSNVYLEPMTGSTASGHRTDPIYPFQQLAVPTGWAYWQQEFVTGGADSGRMYFRWLLNHSTGSNTNTIFYFTGFSIEEMVEGTIISNGAISTRHVEANSINAEKLTIGTPGNMFPDPLIRNAEEWVGTGISMLQNGGRNSSGNAMRITSAGAQRGVYFGSSISKNRVQVVPGRSYNISAWVRPSVNTTVTSNVAVYGRLYPESGVDSMSWTSPSYFNAGYVSSFPANTWTKVEGTLTVPEGTQHTFLAPGFYIQSGYPSGNTMDWCDISITEMAGGELIVDGAIDGKVITGALIQTDRAENVGVKLSNQGIEAYGPDGEKTLKITGGNGTGVDYIGVWGHKDAVVDTSGNVVLPTGQDAQTVASIDPTGVISSRELSVDEYARMDGNVVINGDPLTDSHLGTDAPGEWGPVINGRSLLGTTFVNFVEQHPQVTDVNSWLTPLAHGFKSNAYVNDDTNRSTGKAGSLSSDGRWKWSGNSGGLVERMMIQQQIEVVNNRGYLLSYSVPALRATDPANGTDVGASVIRYTTSSSLNVNTGGVLADTRIYIPGDGNYFNPAKTVYFVGGQDVPAGTITFGIQVYVYSGRTMETTNTADARYWTLSIMDMGLATKGNTGKAVDLYRKLPISTTPEEVSPPPPPPIPDPVQYTKTWNAVWWSTYDSSGKNSYYESRGRVAQGNPPGSAGIQRGLVGFDSSSITSTLSGATVKKVEVYVYAAHWYYSGGGTLVIGTHNHASEPSSYSSGEVDIKRQKLAKPEGRWITLPSSTHAGFKGGSRKGIQTYINSSSLSYYGYLTGSKTRLRITYTK